MTGPNLNDYVDVAERIREFKAEYPEGTLQSLCDPVVLTAGDKTYIAYGAAAYRTPDDVRPGIGWAWEPVPGPTTFTKDSELQNAETSAWGRAIVALGFETKRIASANEVRNRTAEKSNVGVDSAAPSQAQKDLLKATLEEAKAGAPDVDFADIAKRFMQVTFSKADSSQLNADEYNALIAHLKLKAVDAATPF